MTALLLKGDADSPRVLRTSVEPGLIVNARASSSENIVTVLSARWPKRLTGRMVSVNVHLSLISDLRNQECVEKTNDGLSSPKNASRSKGADRAEFGQISSGSA